MKKKTVLLGTAGIILAVGLVLFAGCDTGTSGGGDTIDKSLQGKWYTDSSSPTLVYEFTGTEMKTGATSVSAETSGDKLIFTSGGVKTELTWEIIGNKLYITTNGIKGAALVKNG